MRVIYFVLSVIVLLGGTRGLGAERARGARASIQAILVVASNQTGEPDKRLSAYEPTLRRILRFQSYRTLGEGSASVALPGSGSIALGRGHRLEIVTEESGGDQVRAKVRWLEGDRELMGTVLVLRRGVPAVLGGPARSEHGEVYAVIVIAS